MAKISLDTLLTRAEEQFSLGKYESALTTYGLLLKEYPTDSDAQVGVFYVILEWRVGKRLKHYLTTTRL